MLSTSADQAGSTDKQAVVCGREIRCCCSACCADTRCHSLLLKRIGDPVLTLLVELMSFHYLQQLIC